MNSEEFSCIKQVVKTVQLSLPLMYISNEFAGITGVLDSWRRQYVKQLQGIVVSYRNVSLTSRYGSVSIQRSYVIYNVKATFDLFCPNIGDIVKGKINRVSKEHIGCLIQETINVNIHLPRNSPSGLSKYIFLDREILFEISHFSCEPNKVIRVTGDITAKCIELMNDLFPAVEEDAVSSPFGDENNTSDREVGRINLSMLNSVKTAKKAEGKSKKSKKRKRESESSALESTEESPKKETVKVEVKTPKKKKMRSLDGHLTDSPGKTSKIKYLSNNLEDLPTSPEKTPKKKKSKKEKDSIKNVIQSPKKESNLDASLGDLEDETVELSQEHLNLLDAIKSEVGLLQTPAKSKGSGEKNTKKRKREEEKSTAKKDKKHKKKNKEGSKSKDKKNPSKKKSKVSASGTVLKKDKKKSKAKKAAKKDDKSKSSKSKKNRKKDKSEKRKSKKLKLSTDDDIKDVIKEIKEE